MKQKIQKSATGLTLKVACLLFALCTLSASWRIALAQQYGWTDISENLPDLPHDTVVFGGDTMVSMIRASFFLNDSEGWIVVHNAVDSSYILYTENGGFWNEPGTYIQNKLALHIPDFGQASDTVVIETAGLRDGSYQLTGLEVLIDSIMHLRASDLEITLTHLGVTITLANQPSDPGENFLWTRLTDHASVLINEGIAPFSGNHKPVQPLSTFNGLNPDGEWILTVYDKASGNTGTLNAWGIKPIFERALSVDEPISAGNDQIVQYLQIQPNPFSETTHIKWKSSKSGLVTLKLYNISGQEMATLVKSTMPEGEFSINFNGSALKPGIYFCSFSLSNQTLIKKVIKL